MNFPAGIPGYDDSARADVEPQGLALIVFHDVHELVS
jgi:hypothetical protein